MKTIAERLKAAREWKGWKQAQLAVAADVSTGTIGNIEAGIRQSKGSIPQIAAALGVDYQWLANGKGEMLPAPSAPNQPLAPVTYAQAAINNVSSLDVTLRSLSVHLAQVEPGRRESVVTLMASLVRTPDDDGLRAALTALLTPSGFAETPRKVA